MILSETGLARERFDAWCHTRGIKPRLYAQVAGNEAIVSMVGLGFGIGVVPQIVLTTPRWPIRCASSMSIRR